MNAKQKKFITEKLIPFILRAEGNGFAMDTWKQDFTKQVQNDVENGDDFYFDHARFFILGIQVVTYTAGL